MGRIKTQMIKSITHELFQHYEDEISEDFEENKDVVEKHVEGGTKKLRNIVAGYATRLKKQKHTVHENQLA